MRSSAVFRGPLAHAQPAGRTWQGANRVDQPYCALQAAVQNPRPFPLARLHCPARSLLVPTSAAAGAASAASNNLPVTPIQMTDQAAACASAALEAGQLRQTIEFLLPVNEKERSFTATEADDYPCSLQKEFDTVCTLTTSLLRRIVGDPTAEITARRLDDGGVEGEPCAVLFPSATKSIAAVVFPTAERLNQIKSLAKETSRPLLIVNPQWREEGQVISDFGIGPWKKAALDFLATFIPIYSLKERRIGSPGTVNGATGTRFTSGGVMRVLRRWPEGYEAYAMAADGSSQLLQTVEKDPSYKELDAMIQDGRQRKMEIFTIAQNVTYLFAGDDDEEVGEGASGAAAEESEEESDESGLMTDADIDALDAASVRRLLAKYGCPASGKLSKLKERLKEAVAAAQ